MGRFLKRVAQFTAVSHVALRVFASLISHFPDLRYKAAMRARLKRVRGTASVFFDVGFDKAEAQNPRLRSELMMR
jgi:hypothetical protein